MTPSPSVERPPSLEHALKVCEKVRDEAVAQVVRRDDALESLTRAARRFLDEHACIGKANCDARRDLESLLSAHSIPSGR